MQMSKEALLSHLCNPWPSSLRVIKSNYQHAKPWLVAYLMDDGKHSDLRFISTITWWGYDLETMWSHTELDKYGLQSVTYTHSDLRIIGRLIHGRGHAEYTEGDLWNTSNNQPLLLFRDSVGGGKLSGLNLQSGFYSNRPLKDRGITTERLTAVLRPRLAGSITFT